MAHFSSWTALFAGLFIINSGIDVEAALDCNPGKVTCCFTVDNALQRVFVDGKDVTDQVEPKQAFINWRKPKTITFDEPLHSSTIAIEGYVYNALESTPLNSGLILSCTCSRPNSPWNFVSGPNGDWSSVNAIGLNKLPENWHRYEYSGIVSRVLESDAGFSLNWAQCPSPIDEGFASMARRVAAAPSTAGLFTFRKQIEQDPALLVCPASKPPPLPESNLENEPCGTVTCCMTADTEIVAAYIDGVDITSNLQPNGEELAIWTSVKQVTFDETPSSNAIIAVLGRDRESTHAPDKSGIQVTCTSTRETSAWNFVRTFDGSQIWESIPVDSSGSAPNLWFMGNYSGPSMKAVKSTSKFFMLQPICGPIDKFRKVAAEASSNTSFFALRASFPQTKTCVVSNSDRPPTASPTMRDPFRLELELKGTVHTGSKSFARDQGGWGGVDVEQLSASKTNEARKAVGYWESVIIRSLPTSVCIPAGTVLCGYSFASERCFADILVLVSVQSGLIANSETMVCGTDVTGRPRVARIILSKTLSTENIQRVTMHAMAHALGFGTMWSEFDVIDQTTKTYTGLVALDEFKSISSSSSSQLEVEIVGNGLGHWHTNSLPNELMNRKYSSSNPISRITLMSFFDLLYDVNMSMAEPYSLSQASLKKKKSPSEQQHAAIVQEPEATSDILSMDDMTLLPSTVKPGRQAEYERDLEAKRLRDDRRAARTSTNNELAFNIGAIIGIGVGGVMAVGAVVLFLVVRSRRNSKSNRARSSNNAMRGRRASSRRSSLLFGGASPPADQHGWMEKFDVENNTTYWINQFTGEFSWSNPNAVLSNEPRSPPVSTSEIVVMAQPDFGEEDDHETVVTNVGTDWQETVDEASHYARYYIKQKTGEFSWVMPPQ